MPDAKERLSLVTCAFVAGCILLAPRQWASAGIAFALSLVLLVWHLVRVRAETPRGPSTARPVAADAQRSPGEEPAEPA